MSRDFFKLRDRLELYGTMPERATLRLRRAGIPLYDMEKPRKDCLRFTVSKRDVDKVFAIYPKSVYQGNGYTPYSVRSLGKRGVGRYVEFARGRVGFLLGAGLFAIATLYADSLVFGVDFSASSVYQREARAVLEEYGIKPFSVYERGKEDLICSKILSLNGVEFCSVKKSGLRVVVEMRLGDSPKTTYQTGDMYATREGKLLSITALKGTVVKRVGDSVLIGEPLVGAWTESADGIRRETEVIARASIACTYACEIQTADEKEAFAIAYMQAGLTQEDRIDGVETVAIANGYQVKIEYVAIESFNL